MATHMECIGMAVEPGDPLVRLLSGLLNTAVISQREDGGQTAVWRDASGAGLTWHYGADRRLGCMTPIFAARHHHKVEVSGFERDPDCSVCDLVCVHVLDDAGEMAYPLILSVEDILRVRHRLQAAKSANVAITLFAEQVYWWPNEEAYERAPRMSVKFAPESFVPMGPLAPQGLIGQGERRMSCALVTGRVVRSERRRNTFSGRPFLCAAVKSYPDVFDLVASPEDFPEPLREGNIVQGEFWAIGSMEA